MRDARRLLSVLAIGAVVGLVVSVASGIVMPGSRAEAQPSASELQRQIKQQSKALEVIVEQYNGVTEQLKSNQAKEKKLLADLAPLQNAMDAAQSSVGDLARQAYMAGPVDSLTVLITSNDTAEMLDQLATLNQFATNQQHVIADYANLAKTYTSDKTQLDSVMATESALKANLTAQKKTITAKLAKLYQERKQLYGSATEATGGSHPPAPYIAGRGGKVVDFAYAQLGKPYAWAADGPNSYDCSGLTLAAYRTVGVTLYHKVSVQWTEVTHLSRSSLKPGDLVFYSGLSHVAIYIGSSKVIHAPTFGEVVKISPIDMESIYGYGRP